MGLTTSKIVDIASLFDLSGRKAYAPPFVKVSNASLALNLRSSIVEAQCALL